MKFNEKILELRKGKGYSQEELSFKLNVARQTISKWESGSTTPDMDNLIKLSKIFDISVDELIGKEISKEDRTNEELVRIEYRDNDTYYDINITDKTYTKAKCELGKELICSPTILKMEQKLDYKLKLSSGWGRLFLASNYFYKIYVREINKEQNIIVEPRYMDRYNDIQNLIYLILWTLTHQTIDILEKIMIGHNGKKSMQKIGKLNYQI